MAVTYFSLMDCSRLFYRIISGISQQLDIFLVLDVVMCVYRLLKTNKIIKNRIFFSTSVVSLRLKSTGGKVFHLALVEELRGPLIEGVWIIGLPNFYYAFSLVLYRLDSLDVERCLGSIKRSLVQGVL